MTSLAALSFQFVVSVESNYVFNVKVQFVIKEIMTINLIL